MFLRRHTRKRDNEVYEYWTLVESVRTQVQADVEVKLCQSPDGQKETFVLCRSTGRIEKERAMRGKQDEHLEKALNKLKERIDATKKPLRDHSQAERRVGRLFQKYSRAARLFTVAITQMDDPEHKSGKRLAMTIERNKPREITKTNKM